MIEEGPDHGLFVDETRLLSRYRYTIDGEEPLAVALSNVEQHSWLGYYIVRAPGLPDEEPDEGSGQVPGMAQEAVELRVSRYVGGGLHEDIDLMNYTQHRTRFALEIEIDADFADQRETRGDRKQRGRRVRDARRTRRGWELDFDYRASHRYAHQGDRGTARIHRGISIRVEDADSPPQWQRNRIRFNITLRKHARWHACIVMTPRIDEEVLEPLYQCRSFRTTKNEFDRRRVIFLQESSAFKSPGSDTLTGVVVGALEQAKRDLAALRLYKYDRGIRAWTAAAGLPIYIALFGRDTLTASWQAGLISPDIMRGTIEELPKWQGTRVDDWRDEQPGRMIHEVHSGPLPTLNFNPLGRNYGSVTTSNLYPFMLSELWHWTGNRSLVRQYIPAALEAIHWADRCSDLDGDGFFEYQTRSEQGVIHQAWKDSKDAMVYEDGRQAYPPIAACEEQGFAYVARLHFSETLWSFGYKDEAKRLFHEASELKKRFNEAFWDDDEGTFILGLDAKKRPLRSVASNAGHALATGIADESLVERCAQRLMKDDLFSGWGVRTLSSEHPAYNPYSYHRGSVWPVEHGTFALGFMRYGLHDFASRISRVQFEAAAIFDWYRLPELFSGHPRDDDHPFPALYPQANAPQAWSSTALFSMLQAMLGLYPYAPLKLLLVDPHLPDWLPEITLERLRVGRSRVTIRFRRKANGESTYDVLDQRGTLHVIRQPSPWSLTATWPERVRDFLISLLPGK